MMQSVRILLFALYLVSAADAGVLGRGASSSNGGGFNYVPIAAAQVGYNTLTYNSTVLGSATGDWQPFNFYSNTPSGTVATQNGNGSFFMSGNNQGNAYGGGVATAVQANGTTQKWTGLAFGGGAYFEATVSFTGQTDYAYTNGGPAFWLKDIEQMSLGPYANTWPGVVSPAVSDYIEIDIMEYDSADDTYPYAWQTNYDNWYSLQSAPSTTLNEGPSITWTDAVPGSQGSILVPNGTDFSQPHKYGFLWVPATGTGITTATQGYCITYFDGVQVAGGLTGSRRAYWNFYDPTDTGSYPGPPPVNFTTALSIMDSRHMVMILGNGTSQPMTVWGMKVWQTSSANNLQY